jgi:predicted phage terminase large subunit-like protein
MAITEKQAAAQRMLAQRQLCRRRLIHFTKAMYPKYDAGWAHQDIARRLEKFSEDVRAGRSPRLMIMCPPRMGKSELASIRFPAWHLGQAPDHEIIAAGYSVDLPIGFSRKIKDILNDPEYKGIFPGTQLHNDVQAATGWRTTAGGGYTPAGRGGAITGKGAHILIIDDPIKNQEEADSGIVRDSLWDWYATTAYTRLAPGGGVLVIQTCWSDDDLAGRLQRKMEEAKREGDPYTDQFEIVKYPGLAMEWEYRDDSNPEVWGPIIRSTTELDLSKPEYAGYTFLRAPGEAVHPERFDAPALLRFKKQLGERFFSALYQQSPVPDDGLYFRREMIQYAPSPEMKNVRVFTAWDFAIGTKQHNDYTVGATMALTADDELHVLDIYRLKGDALEICDAIIAAARKWGKEKEFGYTVGCENGQIWLTLKPFLERRMREERLFFPIEVMKPLTDKMVRARPLQGRMQQGRVWFKKDASWAPEMETELLRFPSGVHDDIVDALAWSAHLALSMEPPRVPQKPREKSWKDKLFSLTHEGSFMSA